MGWIGKEHSQDNFLSHLSRLSVKKHAEKERIASQRPHDFSDMYVLHIFNTTPKEERDDGKETIMNNFEKENIAPFINNNTLLVGRK